MADATLVAQAFRYPEPGHLETLGDATSHVENPSAQREMVKFVDAVGRLTLEQWEELHTITLDLSPLFVPYVGHVVWGENYRRGAFMADLARAQTAAGVDAAGELPDHLEPILRYLDAAPSPMSDLVEILPQALARMIADLHSADAKNPYRHVLRAVSAVIDERVTAARSVSR